MSKARDLAGAATALNAVTPTELGYLDGVTSAVQTQIDAKEATLPSQTGNSGKYLTTNGSAKSWGTVSQYALPSQSGNSGKFLTTNGTAESWGVPTSTTNYTYLGSVGMSGSTVTTITGLSGYNQLRLYVVDMASNVGTMGANFYLNGENTGTNYLWYYQIHTSLGSGYSGFSKNGGTAENTFSGLHYTSPTGNASASLITINGANSSGLKMVEYTTASQGSNGNTAVNAWGLWRGSAVVSSLSIQGSVNITSGTVYIYGA